jgi:tRNA(Ile)-lysidine synthase
MPLDEFPERFAFRFHHLIGQRLVVALSGGPDSVALLHLLRHDRLRLELEAAHVHHSVRGSEADQDATFCRLLCQGLEIPFHLLRIEPGEGLESGREAAWREQRYRALQNLKDRLHAAAVVTGHQRDDVAEGVLMQLLRGAGPRALAGIAAETPGGVVRPLLAWSRADILDWLREENLSWREDSSNQDLNHLRNRVRHIVLPELRAVSPQIADHLVALAGALAVDEAYFAEELRSRCRWIEPWTIDGGVPVTAVQNLPKPLQSRWLHAQAHRVAIGKVSRRQLELFARLLDQGLPRAVSLAGRWRIRLARGRLWLEPPTPPAAYQIALEPGLTCDLPLPGWQVTVRSDRPPDPAATWHRRFPDGAELSVRSPRPADLVSGREGSIRVSRLLARKIPRHLRRSWPLLCENDRITWIPGVWQGSEAGNLVVEVSAHGGAASRLHR